jgi:hypothetical protein
MIVEATGVTPVLGKSLAEHRFAAGMQVLADVENVHHPLHLPQSCFHRKSWCIKLLTGPRSAAARRATITGVATPARDIGTESRGIWR